MSTQTIKFSFASIPVLVFVLSQFTTEQINGFAYRNHIFIGNNKSEAIYNIISQRNRIDAVIDIKGKE